MQHVHTLPSAAPPIAVHMTYQFAEGSKFAHGKRQRLRQAGLWLVEDEDYYNGRFITVSEEGATLAVQRLGPRVTSKVMLLTNLQHQHQHQNQNQPRPRPRP